MKLVSFNHHGRAGFRRGLGDGIVDLRPRLPRYHTLLDVLRAGALDEVRELRPSMCARISRSPMSNCCRRWSAPEKILCIGVNYANRNEEYKDTSELPKYPSMFFRTPGSFVGPRRAADPPAGIRAARLRRRDRAGDRQGMPSHHARSRRTTTSPAIRSCNEGTIRDWLRHAKFNVTQGKNFDRSGSIGPWMVTADEIEYGKPLRIVTTTVNGEIAAGRHHREPDLRFRLPARPTSRPSPP